jgi:hypothetical protein
LEESDMRLWPLKLAITGGAVVIIGARLLWPDLKLDAVTLGLLVVAVLPWLSPLIKSAEFPGGWKIEFQDVKAAGDRVTGGVAVAPAPGALKVEGYAPTVVIAPADPNIALVGVRIDIERRLRTLSEMHAVPTDQSALRMAKALAQKGVLNDDEFGGLRQLIDAGNRAAHGAAVSPEVSSWVHDYAPDVLAALDAKAKR